MAADAELLLELKHRVGCCIDAAGAKLHRLSEDIWGRPELAYEERAAHDRLVAFFSQEEGWTVDDHFKLNTAFRAAWGPPSGEREHAVNVGFLCEYDALPGIGHGCGHNLIAEVGAAAALGVKAVLENTDGLPVGVQVGRTKAKASWVIIKLRLFAKTAEEQFINCNQSCSCCCFPLEFSHIHYNHWSPQVTVLGTPAEEDGGGKIDLLKEGAFDDLDVVFMAHPSKEDAVYLPCVAEHE